MPTQFSLRDVTISRHGRRLLEHADLAVPQGERLGVIGENGSGKSTLLEVLAGRRRPDAGDVIVTARGTVGYLPQRLPVQPDTVQEAVDAAFVSVRATEAALRRLEDQLSEDPAALDEYGRMLDAFAAMGGYELDANVERALHVLGLSGLDRDRPLCTLSGGEQVRLQLALLVCAEHEALLLDEPTNHLDGSALDWLEARLIARTGTSVVVSHDRDFLERVATALVEVDPERRTLRRYGGGYAAYLREKHVERVRWEQRYADWSAERARLKEAAASTARRVAHGGARRDGNKMAYDRHGARVQQSVASRVRNAEQRLARLEATPVPAPPDRLSFRLGFQHAQGDGTVVMAKDVAVRGRLRSSSLTLTAGDHLLVTGPNGSGKTTLLDVLAGRVPVDSGELRVQGRVGYLPQDDDDFDLRRTVARTFADRWSGPADASLQVLAALGLFTEDQVRRRVGELSVGQRRRLSLALLVSEPADLLLLDEPTNHLSLALVEEIELALSQYRGTVVVVTHDRRMIRRWPGRIRGMVDGRLSPEVDSQR